MHHTFALGVCDARIEKELRRCFRRFRGKV
jgi:hypothetical protein